MISKFAITNLIFFTLFTLQTYSQEENHKEPNLDFEVLHGNEAKGWDELGDGEYLMGIDTTTTWSGKKSAFIEAANDATGFKAWSFSIPANYDGEKLKLTGYIKTQDISEGFAGLWMRVDPKVAFYNMHDRGVTGTTEWQKYEIELDYDSSKAENIVIGGLLVGKGKMWLDNLELTLDGKKLEHTKKAFLTTEIKQSLLKEINQINNEVKLLSDDELEEGLQSLVESIGDKKIVAIGEDTHGTSEFYRLREAITKKLIIEKGFNVVVLENPYDDIELFVKGVPNKNLDTLMQKHLFSIYQTKEMRSFLNWYKGTGLRKNVTFKGSDDSYWRLPALLEKELSIFNDKKLNALSENLKDAATLTVEEYNQKQSKSHKQAKNENQLGLFTYEATLDLEEYLISKGLINPILEEYLFNLKSTFINFSHLANQQPIQSRDEMMAKRIAYFAKDPKSKIIVWAHNAHVSNIVIMDGEIGLMGQDLKKEFGNDYHSIGLSSLKGSYTYIENRFINNDPSYDDKLYRAQLNFQPEDSWEQIFSKVGSNAFYFETKDLKNIKGREHLKLLGYGKEKATDYYKLSPLNMFDMVFFIETTSATKPLFN